MIHNSLETLGPGIHVTPPPSSNYGSKSRPQHPSNLIVLRGVKFHLTTYLTTWQPFRCISYATNTSTDCSGVICDPTVCHTITATTNHIICVSQITYTNLNIPISRRVVAYLKSLTLKPNFLTRRFKPPEWGSSVFLSPLVWVLALG